MPVELQQKIKQEVLDTGTISKKLLRQVKEWADKPPECVECGSTLNDTMFKNY